MQWLNIELSTLENEAFGCADTAHLGAWLRLMRYCCIQENSGRIRGAKEWPDRKWMHLFRLTKDEIDQKSELWAWDGGDLRVLFFPTDQLKKVKRLREQSQKANETRWGKPHTDRDPNRMPSGIPSGIPDGNPESESGSPECKGNSKDKGKGKSKGKDKGKRGAPAPTGTGHKPRSIAEAITFFTAHEGSEAQARKFFTHYQANGWKQGGGLLVASWPDQAEKWIGTDREEAKKSSGGVAAPFDGRPPHAHTGGVEVLN